MRGQGPEARPRDLVRRSIRVAQFPQARMRRVWPHGGFPEWPYLCELDPIYCDRILARWEAYAKDGAEQTVCGWPQEMQVREAAE